MLTAQDISHFSAAICFSNSAIYEEDVSTFIPVRASSSCLAVGFGAELGAVKVAVTREVKKSVYGMESLSDGKIVDVDDVEDCR